MTTELVPVFAGEIAGAPTQLVDARLLHGFLEVLTRFNDWIRTRIEEYGFVEHQDFLVTENRVTKNTRGGDRRSKGYHISIDMAKELAMVERNDKGRQVRRYFIECERRAMSGLPNALKALSSKKALPGGLTLEQQDAIKALVRSRVEALPKERQGGAAITCWSALKTKFGCTYKAIPPDLFAEALSLIARLDLLVPPALPAPETFETPRYAYPLSDWNPETRIGDTGWFTLREWDRLREPGSPLSRHLRELERDGNDVSMLRLEHSGLCHLVETLRGQLQAIRVITDRMDGNGLYVALRQAA